MGSKTDNRLKALKNTLFPPKPPELIITVEWMDDLPDPTKLEPGAIYVKFPDAIETGGPDDGE